jgi:hypothetical protein
MSLAHAYLLRPLRRGRVCDIISTIPTGIQRNWLGSSLQMAAVVQANASASKLENSNWSII